MNEPMFRLDEDRFGSPRRRFANPDAAVSEAGERPAAYPPAPALHPPLAGAAASAS